MKKLVAILFLVSGLPVFAQMDRIDSLLNDLIYTDNDLVMMLEKPVKFDFVYMGANFNSNSFYEGREIGSDLFNVSGHAFYYSSTGLFAGVSGIWFDGYTPSYSATTLSAGFRSSIDKRNLFTFKASYARLLYYKPDTSSEDPYKNNFSLGLSFRKKWIGARVSSSYLFGEENKINISTGVYSNLTLKRFGKSNKIYVAPEATSFLGSETVEIRKNGQNNHQTTTDLTEVYSLLNTQLYFPLGISLGNFDLEVGCSINFPTTQDVNISYPVKSSFSAYLLYILPVQKKEKE